MKWNKDWENKKWVPMTIAICIGVVLFLFLSHLSTVFGYIGGFLGFFRSVGLGVVFAYLLNPLVRLFEFRILKNRFHKTTRHVLSMACAVILVLFALFILGFSLIPQVVSSIGGFIQNLDSYTKSAQGALESVSEFLAKWHIDASNLMESVQSFFSGIQNALPSGAAEILSLLGGIGSNIVDVLIAFILALYFLADKERLFRGIRKIMQVILKPETYREVTGFLVRGNDILIRYILFDLLDGLFVGAANFIFMLIAGMPYGVLVSVVVGVTNLAPTFGPIVGGVIGAFLLFLVKPMFALEFLIFTVAIQIFDGYILKPKLFGGALGVPGVIVIVCIVVGGKMFGVWGILLAIPFAAIAYFALREAVATRWEKKYGEPEEKPPDDAQAV